MSDHGGWSVRVAGPASRKLAEVLPEAVAAAVVEFIAGPLLENPHRVGRPLRNEFAGRYAARRGTFRIVYRINDSEGLVEVIDIGHRADIYRT